MIRDMITMRRTTLKELKKEKDTKKLMDEANN